MSPFFTLFAPFILLKKNVSISRFERQIGLKSEQPLAEIFTKMFFEMALQTKPPANNVFSQISQLRLGHFLNRFLR